MSSELVVIGFDDEYKAFELRAALARMQKEYLIEMGDVVVVTKNEKGKVEERQKEGVRMEEEDSILI